MGLNFSSSKDVYMHTFKNPKVKRCSKQISIKSKDNNPFKDLVSSIDEHQYVHILGLYVNYISNDTPNTLEYVLSGLFEGVGGKNQNEDVKHVDDCGMVKIICPANYDQEVKGNDRILYIPRLPDDILEAFSGLGEIMMKKNELDSEYILLELTNPIVYFIKYYSKEHLNPKPDEFIMHPETGYYEIKVEFLNKAREFFKNTIYDDFHPTRFENTEISCKNGDGGNVFILLEIHYLLITNMPDANVLKHSKIKI